MKVIEVNVKTGKKTIRPYTKKEMDAAESYRPSELDVWIDEISSLDQFVDRKFEETIDAIGKEKFSDFIQQKYDEKKALRAQKPQE